MQNADNCFFVKTLLSFAQGFGLQTVAEFVETGDVAKILMAALSMKPWMMASASARARPNAQNSCSQWPPGLSGPCWRPMDRAPRYATRASTGPPRSRSCSRPSVGSSEGATGR